LSDIKLSRTIKITGIITIIMNNKLSSCSETRGIYQNVNSRKKNQEFFNVIK